MGWALVCGRHCANCFPGAYEAGAIFVFMGKLNQRLIGRIKGRFRQSPSLQSSHAFVLFNFL